MKETIFREGDRVYDIRYGWGTVVKHNDSENYPISVKFDQDISQEFMYYTECGKSYKLDNAGLLSFTEYDLVNGGFSQERLISNHDHIGKWGRFWNEDEEESVIGKLYNYVSFINKPFMMKVREDQINHYQNFEPLTEQQLEILQLK